MNAYKALKVGFFLFWGGIFSPMLAFAQPMTLVHKDNQVFLSYDVTPTPETDIFWAKVVDMLRAGHLVKIEHAATLLDRESFLGKTKVEKTWVRYVSYNLFEDTYFYGVTPDKMVATTAPNKAKHFVLNIVDELFLEENTLKTARLYEVRTRIKATKAKKEKGFWLFSPLRKIFSPTLTRQFTHVAR